MRVLSSVLASVMVFVGVSERVSALDNGLALTPPMGWLSWERFRCDIDCTNDPYNCISESLYTDMADRMAADGWIDVGYEYVNIDDCWAEKDRDSAGQLQPDRVRFPDGMSWLADYVHALGLKLGTYGDYGSQTCGGYPGSENYLQLDANTLAEWTIDSWKMDGCNVDLTKMSTGYPAMSKYLNGTGRPILYSCSWPAYTFGTNNTNWSLIVSNCNLWRMYDDIQDDWNSVVSIINFMFDQQDLLQPMAGPGHWNDPDMVICGNFALSIDECRAQFAVWSILAAPLYLSVDLRTIRPEFVQILQNREVIAIDQDSAGIQGRRVSGSRSENIQVFSRPLANGDTAVVIFNNDAGGMPSNVTVSFSTLSLKGSYVVRDLYAGADLGRFTDSFHSMVNPHGANIFRLRESTSGLVEVQ